MDFAFPVWTEKQIGLLDEHLLSIAHPKNAERENRIVRTAYPMLSTYTKELRDVAKSIMKGNYVSFLDYNPLHYHEHVLLQGFVISEIKDACVQMRLLPAYLKICDSWAQTDSLKFRITAKTQENWFSFAKDLTKSQNTFERRCGLLIFFKFLQTDKLDEIFGILNGLKDEKEYYVNMAMAWLVCDAFITRREETLSLLSADNLSPWVQNKAISKCRDSFRVSPEDKLLLLNLKK
ncbi:MAG: DNA alkylation repair protein [Clostridia bacterium]|nr:DNA alkylation repair protein [Clostridia bacterium]